MRIGNRLVKLASAMALVVLTGCSGTFRTYYDDPVPAAQSANWRLSSVHVTAPRSLVVSEEEVYVPKADIVWREDPSGNRYEQVEALMERAIARGAAGLHGARPVTIEATMVRDEDDQLRRVNRLPEDGEDVFVYLGTTEDGLPVAIHGDEIRS